MLTRNLSLYISFIFKSSLRLQIEKTFLKESVAKKLYHSPNPGTTYCGEFNKEFLDFTYIIDFFQKSSIFKKYASMKQKSEMAVFIKLSFSKR